MHRPRLAATLTERFSTRLVTIEAGAGFGKTTLLAQALAMGVGIDAYVSCDSGDAARSRLLAALLTSLGRPPADDAFPTVLDVAEAAWAMSPNRVCLILDDLHWIDPDSPSLEALDELLRELPENASMVWAGRSLPVRGRARLLATGQAVELTEPDLLLTRAELAELAATHGLEVSMFDELAGWPALAELTAKSGRAIAMQFVDDEILSRLSPHDRDAFIAAVAVGGGDAELIGAAAGSPVDLGRLARIPLVSFDEQVGIRPHHLWAELLAEQLRRAEVVDARRRAVGVLIARRQFADAYEILAAADDWTAALDVLVEGCNDQRRPPWGDLLAEWRRSVPATFSDRPEVLYLEAMIERVADPWSPDCRAQFDRAIRAFRDAGQIPRALACNVRATYIDWICGDADRQERNLKSSQTAVERGLARPDIIPLTVAALADIRGDTATIRELTNSELAVEARLDHFAPLYRSLAELYDGDPGRAVRFAERAAVAAEAIYPAGGTGFARLAPLVSMWSAGSLLPTDHPALVDPGPRLPLPERVPWLTLGAVVAAHGLDFDRAEQRCALIDELVRNPESRGLLAGCTAVAHATLACARGDEAGAAEHLRVRLTGVVLTPTGAGRIIAWFPAIPYLLSDGCRAWLDERRSIGARRDVIEACRALLGTRQGRAVPALAIWDQDDLLLTSLPPPQAVELAIAGAVDGHAAAVRHVHRLAESHPVTSRERIADALARPNSRAQRIGRLRRDVAFAPSERLRIETFGALRLFRGDAPVDHRDLRRERVRQLLGALVIHRSIRRELLGSLLWPDFDEAAVSANLRQTLSYVQGLLEPWREKGDAPWFIRQAAGILQLRDDATITIDAWQVDHHLDAADRAAAEGSPSRQLSELRHAIDAWNGELLTDLIDAEWAMAPRQRMHDRLVQACIRSGELLMAARRHGEARSVSERALAAEPWAEPAHRIVISSYLAGGDRSGARRAAARCRTALDELGVAADARTAAVLAAV